MKTRLGWAILLAVGVLIGCVLGGYQKSNAGGPVPVEGEDRDDPVGDQLKQIRQELKELNGMLRSGKARVTPVINPGA
jgi:hypothetical protein